MCRLVIYKVLLLSSLEGYCSFERKIKILKNVHMEKEHWLRKISLWPQIREILRIKFLIKFFAKTLSIYLFFIFLQNYKMIIKSFECPKYIRNYEKRICTWNVRHLVDESFVPSTQQTSVLYCRLSDFKLFLMMAVCIRQNW